jgi:hypothetical protein
MGRFAVALWVFPVWVLPACATAPPPAPPQKPAATATASPVTAPMVEKMREQLQVAPWEIVLSGVRGEQGPTETVTARNLVDRPVTVSSIKVMGEAASLFTVKDAPALPITIPAKGTLSVEVALGAPVTAEAGLKRAVLRFQTGEQPDVGPAADLSALILSGREPEAEPPLQQIVESLGFAVDVGGRTLQLAADTGGEQITSVALFERARPGPVALNPVARFSPDGALPYGFYRAGTSLTSVDTRQLGTVSAGQNQTVNPSLEPDAITSFDPGDGRFGIWMDGPNADGSTGDRVYSENRRNRGKPRALARVFPLKSRGGAPIPDAYLIAFGTAERADFQDGVFVLWNVKLAGAP